jgi:O-antigen/teichoic acid export membrane protein
MRRKNETAPKTGSFKTNAITLFHYGTPLYISALLTGFLPIFKNMILALFTTDIAIGNYKAAINFAAFLLALAGPITTVLLPAFSKLNSTTNHKIKAFYKIANKYASMIIIPVTVLIITLSKEIIQTIYGATYEPASLFLSIYCLTYFLVGIGYLTLPSLYNGVGETKTTMKMNLIDALSLIILAVPLTQTYGVQGIIAAFLIAKTVSILYGANKARRKLKVEFGIKTIIKIYIISALSAVAPLVLINFTNLPTILTVALSGIFYLFIYITLLPLAYIVTPTELQKALQVTRKTMLLTLIIKPVLKYHQKILQLLERVIDR